MVHQADTPDDSTVPRHTRLFRRGSRYYLRVKVPVDLQSAMGRMEIKWSLGTSDAREAERRIKFESAKADAIFETERAKLNGGKTKGNGDREAHRMPLRILSQEHAQEFARTWFLQLDRVEKEWWENTGRSLKKADTEETLSNLWHIKASITGEAPDVIPPEARSNGRGEVALFLASHDWSIREDEPGYGLLCAALREARLESVRRAMDRIEGNPFRCYDPLFLESSGAPSTGRQVLEMTVKTLGAKFIADQERAKKAPKTIFAYTIHARLLCEIVGEETSIHRVARPDVEKVCEVLETMPSNATKRYPGKTVHEAILAAKKTGDTSRLSVNSRRNYFFNLFSIFQYAVKTKVLAENPFDDYWLKQRFTPSTNEQNPDDTVTFTTAQLREVFAAPLYTGAKDDESGFAKPGPNIIRRGRFWVPLIALFHGLRLNEICQLYTQDVRIVEGELAFEVRPFLDRGEAHDKRLKNKASTRTVPVHPELLKMGFAEFVECRRNDKESPRLFPELRSAPKSGSYSDPFSKWFTRFLEKTLGEKPRATFHSFRHGWRDALREADVSEERVNKLGGWAHQGQHARYGRAKLLQLLKVEIGKVRFAGLDLSHLYSPQRK